MNLARVVTQLETEDEVTFTARGSSMTPLIRDGQEVTVRRLPGPPEAGDIVLAKVHGRYYLHLAKAVQGNRVLIGNNHGHLNGWTTLAKCYGHVTG